MILAILNLIKVLNDLKQQDKKIVLTEGCFDLLHIGHLHCLQDAKKLGDILLVGVASDAQIQELKGFDRPIIKEEQRIEMVNNLKCVDYTFLATFTQDVVQAIKPDIYFKGSDYTLNENWTIWQKLYGGECVVGTRLIEIRSSDIIKSIRIGRQNENKTQRISNRNQFSRAKSVEMEN